MQVPCACKEILIVFDNAGTHSACATCARKPTPGAFDYAGSHSAKRNLRDGRRSHAFDNAGSRSACATGAKDNVPIVHRTPCSLLTADRRK